MDETLHKQVIEKSPAGYAYHIYGHYSFDKKIITTFDRLRPEPSLYNSRKAKILSFQADVVPEITPYDLIAQRNLAERARLFI